jgi:hypothetical protein
MISAPPLDLVVLLPGADEQEAIRVLLSERTQSLGIRPIQYRLLKHPQRDPGCFRGAPEILRGYLQECRYALVLFDHEGSGQEQLRSDQLADDLLRRLESAGWRDRAAVLVIVPEFEVWVWSDSPEVDVALSWQDRNPPLRRWLQEKGLWLANDPKPTDPKRAVEESLKAVYRPRSSSVYAAAAQRVSLHRCTDRSFLRLKQTLQAWFGPSSGGP